MRTRSEIAEEARHAHEEPDENCTKRRLGLILEVLLDVRDELTKPDPKPDPKPEPKPAKTSAKIEVTNQDVHWSKRP